MSDLWNTPLQAYKALTYKTSRTKNNYYSMLLKSNIDRTSFSSSKNTLKERIQYKKDQTCLNRIIFQYSAGRYGLSAKERAAPSSQKKMLLISGEFAARYKKKKMNAIIKIECKDVTHSTRPLYTYLKENQFNVVWVTNKVSNSYNGCRLQKNK